MAETKLRSLPDAKDNYADYLIIPLLELSKDAFGDAFINAFVTVNGKIAILVEDTSELDPILWAQHPEYLTDIAYRDGTLILYKCPLQFEQDVLHFMASKFSRMSALAKKLIYELSGLSVDFQTNSGLVSSRMIDMIRRTDSLRLLISKTLGVDILPGEELEPPLRDCDLLYDVDTDITFSSYEGTNNKN